MANNIFASHYASQIPISLFCLLSVMLSIFIPKHKYTRMFSGREAVDNAVSSLTFQRRLESAFNMGEIMPVMLASISELFGIHEKSIAK